MKEFGKWIVIPSSAIFLACFVFLAIGISQVKTAESIDIENDCHAYINYYETHKLAQKDAETTKTYAKALYNADEIEKCLEVLDNMPVLSTNMVVLKKNCTNDWSHIFDALEEQPYNAPLYITISKSNDENLISRAKALLDNAINFMSVPGRKLHELKGDEIL